MPTQVKHNQIRYGAHTDYQGFTILLQDDKDEGKTNSGGLEVFLDDQWIPVPPTKNAFIVNIGDLYERWTNKRWTSTLHRVSNPPKDSEASKRSRRSMVFFTGPTFDAVIEPIRTCVDTDHPSLFKPISAQEHLLLKIGLSVSNK